MSPPDLYLSMPGASFPETSVDNIETSRRVRERYRGADSDWPALQAAIERVFGPCNTRQRYLEPNREARVANDAVAAARHFRRENRTHLEEVALTLHEFLRKRDVRTGDKLVLGSAAAGFCVVVATAQWMRSDPEPTELDS